MNPTLVWKIIQEADGTGEPYQLLVQLRQGPQVVAACRELDKHGNDYVLVLVDDKGNPIGGCVTDAKARYGV